MRYAIFLVLLAGCETVAEINRANIVAELATRTATVWHNLPKAPTPDVPSEGCVDDCTCNGTGREKTGDGLSTVDCRCQDGCECKASNSPEIPDSSPATKQETPTPAAKTVDEPPLVPVAPKQAGGYMECRNGTCYWIENGKRYRVIR